MAERTIAHVYDNYDDATRVVSALEGAGIPSSDISLVGHQAQAGTSGTGSTSADTAEHTGTGAGTGLTLGTVLGGGAGLLAGLGALAIPGVGPIVAAGWLIATVTGAGVGAAAGGLIGSLTGAGVSEVDANMHAEGVRRGGTLVTVRADEMRAVEIETMMSGHNPVNLQSRAAEYTKEGWERFDEKAAPYSGTRATSVPPLTTNH